METPLENHNQVYNGDLVPRLLPKLAQGISIILFAWYGAACFFSQSMVSEFDHWRVPQLRLLVGVLQIAGSIGLIAGYAYRPLLVCAAGSLATLMICGVVVHIRIGDPAYSSAPALVLAALNIYIIFAAH